MLNLTEIFSFWISQKTPGTFYRLTGTRWRYHDRRSILKGHESGRNEVLHFVKDLPGKPVERFTKCINNNQNIWGFHHQQSLISSKDSKNLDKSLHKGARLNVNTLWPLTFQAALHKNHYYDKYKYMGWGTKPVSVKAVCVCVTWVGWDKRQRHPRLLWTWAHLSLATPRFKLVLRSWTVFPLC